MHFSKRIPFADIRFKCSICSSKLARLSRFFSGEQMLRYDLEISGLGRVVYG